MKHPNLTTTLLLQTFLVLGSSEILADETTLTAARDNTIYSEDGTLSNGKGLYLFSGKTAGVAGAGSRRALLAFDVASGIPAGSTITSATLTLQLEKSKDNADKSFLLHRVLRDWGEGSSVANIPEGRGIATANGDGDATWTHRFFSTDTWNAPGGAGDYDIAASAIAQIGGTPKPYTWNSPSLATEVQSMLDNPSSNFGWILIGPEGALEARNAKRFYSLQSTTVATNRPQLTVVFTPGFSPSKMTGINVVDPGEASFEISFESSSDQVYELQFNPFITGIWATVAGFDAIAGFDGTNNLTVTNNTESSGDYRIIANDADAP